VNDCSLLWYGINREMAAANWNDTMNKCNTAIRAQLLTPLLKPGCPIRATRAQLNLSVEKLDV